MSTNQLKCRKCGKYLFCKEYQDPSKEVSTCTKCEIKNKRHKNRHQAKGRGF